LKEIEIPFSLLSFPGMANTEGKGWLTRPDIIYAFQLTLSNPEIYLFFCIPYKTSPSWIKEVREG
jgi:hypothetical protein